MLKSKRDSMVVYVYIKIKWFKEDFLKIAEIMSYDY